MPSSRSASTDLAGASRVDEVDPAPLDCAFAPPGLDCAVACLTDALLDCGEEGAAVVVAAAAGCSDSSCWIVELAHLAE